MVKEGDNIYCYQNYYEIGKHYQFTKKLTSGKFYTIKEIYTDYSSRLDITIIDDTNGYFFVSLADSNGLIRFKNYFYTEQQLRKKKLKKLKSIDLS
jgi:hypothetical protein